MDNPLKEWTLQECFDYCEKAKEKVKSSDPHACCTMYNCVWRDNKICGSTCNFYKAKVNGPKLTRSEALLMKITGADAITRDANRYRVELWHGIPYFAKFEKVAIQTDTSRLIGRLESELFPSIEKGTIVLTAEALKDYPDLS